MEKSVIVIGEVTSRKAREARLRVLNQGHRLKNRRVTFDEFYMDCDELFAKYGSDEERALYEKDPAGDHDELINRLAAKHLETFGAIGAIVLSESDWRLISDSDFIWVTSALEVYRTDEFNYCIIYPDGRAELA